ncbi:hypothetical protein [Quadrisphaera sp. INWT6]|uniref:hypothetical protein n=1 Tax=Quadrisphaera sp. INWT6 TaxID=2596917 RepID=UPI00189264CB|nr:hypothetical protein [Quadrisphaera sp. INWT6]
MEGHSVDKRKIVQSVAVTTAASANLEGQALPPDFVRSPRVAELLAKRRRSA